ncbi:MAG: insulinase family protein [Halobacteriovoraceae bacterium]|nr:insulinase family protein [Halobacteriovoraceae bacterium]
MRKELKVSEKVINGLDTYFIHYPGAKSNSVQFWFRAGSALESGKDLGIAHFLEHMFFKGTKKRPGSKIAYEIESFGGEVNAFTSFDYTCYYINSPKNYLNHSLEILMDMICNPEFKNEELVPERGVVFEEYRRSIDNPSHFHFHQIQKNSFTGKYAHPILGNEKTIKSFSRSQLVAFRKKYYNSNNAALLVTGDFSSEQKLESLIKKYKLPKGSKTKFSPFKIKTNGHHIHVHNKDVSQVTITMTTQAPRYDVQNGAVEDLAINCLAHGETSYLQKELVKNSSLATYASGTTMFMNDGGVHFIKLTFPLKNLDKLLKKFKEVLADVLENKFTEEDLTKIKNQYVASKIYEKESVESFAFSLGHGFAQNGNIYCEDEFISKIKSAQLSDVNLALIEILKRNFHFNVQLPLKIEHDSIRDAIKEFKDSLNPVIKKIKPEKYAVHSKKSKFDPLVQVIKLKEGINLLYRQNPAIPTFVLHAYLKGGLTLETKENCGSHYFIAKSLTYGNKEKKYQDLKLELDTKSASLSGFSGKNAYGLTMQGLSEHFSEHVNDFFNTLLYPEFPESFYNLEIEMLKRMYENFKIDPVKQCFKKFNKLLFKDHPYALDLTGNEHSIQNITQASLRNLHNKNLKSNEILFTYCGDLPLENLITALTPFLSGLKGREIKPYTTHKLTLDKNITEHIEFDREQTQVFIGFPGLPLDAKQNIYLKMLTAYLSGQSSELFVEVRDRQGLCYATQPILHSALEAGYWGIYIGSGADKTQKAIAAIEKILNKLRDKGLKKTEIHRLKKMIVGQKDLQLQSNDDFANYYSIPVLHGLGIDFEDMTVENIKKIEPEALNKFLKKFLSQKQIVVTSGPS